MSEETIERCPHDKENPYSIISNALLRDETISPNCRWLLSYLLSMRNDWKVKITQLINHLKPHMGRDSVRNIITEAITAGYMERVDFMEGNLKRYKYRFAETPKFKKSFRCTDFQDAEAPDAENPPPKKEHVEDIPKEEIVCYPAAVPADSEKPLSKEDLKKISVAEALKGLELPSKLDKKRPDGSVVVCYLEQVFFQATKNKMDWKTSEIYEAWKILADYSGFIRDSFAFIEGTIKNLRTKQKSEYLKKNGDKKCQPIVSQLSSKDSQKSSVLDMKGHPSLQSLLEKAGMM